MTTETWRRPQRGPARAGALLACAVVALLALCLPASASAEQTYFVTVDQSGPVGTSPDVTTRVSPRLPEGATLEGGVRCTQVRVPGSGGYSLSRPEDAEPGYYQIDTDSCRENPNFPLRIEGASGTIRVYGGINNVTRARTAMTGASAVTSGENRTVVLTAEVFNLDFGDTPPIPGQTVRFLYQTFDGQMYFGCDSQTTSDGNGNAVASCVLQGEKADEFFAGTGLWQATYAGTGRYEGSESTGVVPGGATSFEQAAANYQILMDNMIQVVPVPAGCHRVDGSSPNASLLTISLSALACGQLRALQITTNVVLAVTAVVVVVNAPSGLIVEALKAGTYKAAIALSKEYAVIAGTAATL